MSVKNQAKYIYSLSVVLMIFIVSILTTAFGSEITGRTYELYDIQFKTDRLGLYQVTIESHERPSHETLPFISSSYFPYSTLSDQTEVDNTAPEARYHAQGITKVDVVFATGELSQSSQMQDYMDTFESNLQSASNFIDAYVEKVETSTISTSDQDSAEIFNAWWDGLSDSRPSPYWRLRGTRLTIQYSDMLWDRFSDISAEAYAMTDGEISFYTQAYQDVVHEHQYGVGFRLQDGDFKRGYSMSVGASSSRPGYGRVALWKFDGTETELPLYIEDYDRRKLAISGYIPISTLGSARYTITMEGANLSISVNGQVVAQATDSSYLNGSYGIWARHSDNGIWFDDFSITTGSAKTLGEAISDVAWRDGSLRFVIFGTDTIPVECEYGNDDEFAYTVTKLLNANCYLINLGNSTNITQLNRLLEAIRQADGTSKGTFFYNNRPNIITAMNQSADYIIDLAQNLVKPVDWVLVNTEILWNTTYNDQENDPPLNLGEHNGQYEQPQDTSDITLAQSYGLGDAGRTRAYNGSKLLAEKWRYRHYNTFFDNSPVQVSWHEVWIENPVSIFEYPGKYRINYKRRDNPLYPSVDLNDAFDSYRYWSTNYDYLTSGE